MQVTSIDYTAKTMTGTFNPVVDIMPTESFDHCLFLEIERVY